MGLGKDVEEVCRALAKCTQHRVQRVQLADSTVIISIDGLKEIQARH